MKRVIEVRVITNSSVEEVIEGDPVVVKVREPPRDGRANRAVLRLLAKHFNANARMLCGSRGKRKLVELTGQG
ncbi:MAG: DUF167 domain-containing protein [Candidatus Hadarchaeales archaeon]